MMAGILEEFDEATPLRSTYCSRLTFEEYEDEGSTCTEKALSELLEHLEREPDAYKKVVKRRKKEEMEEGGLLAYMKAKVWTWVGGEDISTVSNAECEQRLDKLKEGMVKAFDYSEEGKGRRYSRRIAEKRRRRAVEMATPLHTEQENTVPPAPPPPPSMVPLTPLSTPQLARRPLSERRGAGNATAHSTNATAHSTNPTAHSTNPTTHSTNPTFSGSEPYCHLMHQLQGSGGRKRLRTTTERSPGGTPITGWPRREGGPDLMPYFNAELIAKFRNTRSPARSPNPTLASPGTFDSPNPIL